MTWLGTRGSTTRLRPDHKLAVAREMGVAERVKLARDVLGSLNRIAGQARAA